MAEKPATLKIVLTAVDAKLAVAWRTYCAELPNVTVYEGSILDLEVDAVVSPANSFGFMDGGIDQTYTDHFGPGLQEDLQKKIARLHHGELLVGAAEIVRTGNKKIRFVIAAPTMRVPLPVAGTPNAYLAARAVFDVIRHDNMIVHFPWDYTGESYMPVSHYIKSIALPGLGTGVGLMPADQCARQVRAAILGMERPQNIGQASATNQELCR